MTKMHFLCDLEKHSYYTDILHKVDDKIKFNPSFCTDDRYIYMTYRQKNDNSTNSKLLIWDKVEHKLDTLTDLDISLSWLTKFVKDPKIFIYQSEKYITFNTGHFEKVNNIYVVNLSNFNEWYKIKYNIRSPIEKNLGFFDNKGQLMCIYSLFPLQIVPVNFCKKNNSIHVANKFKNESGRFWNAAIGSQPVWFGDRLVTMVHFKLNLYRKIFYISALIKINSTFDNFSVMRKFIHSSKSLLPTSRSPNRHLYSCAYCSGLEVYDRRRLIVGYGLNDDESCFIEMTID